MLAKGTRLYNRAGEEIINLTIKCMPEIKPEAATDEEAVLKRVKEMEIEDAKKCSAELAELLGKYGYTLEIQQSIVLKKATDNK
jgi:hypothetical protein